jgi:micrococcal nuclease
VRLARGIRVAAATAIGAAAGPAAACGGDRCGPAGAVVARVIDGDTVELATGERVRYLLVDTPEISGTPECYGAEAARFNRDLVEERAVELAYDVECEDRYGRLLAYVTIAGSDVSALLIERGYGCVLHIPPNGADRVDAYRALQAEARAAGRGLWGACQEDLPCR